MVGSGDGRRKRLNRSGDASRVEAPPRVVFALEQSRGETVRRQDRVTLLGSGGRARTSSTPARVGFVCPPCGRFVPTSVEGVVLRDGRGSPPRFCSPSCRQAAYRRRQAGVAEDMPLQLGGGRDRSLKRSGAKAARSGRRRECVTLLS